MKREVRIEGKSLWIDATREGDKVLFSSGESAQRTASIVEVEPGIYSVLLEGKSYRVHLARGRDQWLASLCGREDILEVIDPRARSHRAGALAGDARQILSAPMPGKVVKRLVNEGDIVESGQGIIVVEAMKMQNELRAAHPGHVVSLPVPEGATVTAGETLAVIELQS
jgi:acetyl/propionyl-CoA carboxylase alpha subunit